MARKLIIAGNWKMYHNIATTRTVLTDLIEKVKDITEVDIAICPPITSLPAALEVAAGSNVAIGAQNIHWAEEGAYTGEVSAGMLEELGPALVIIGHSERRQYFGETDETVNKRLKAALKTDIVPIVCVGETLEQRVADQTRAVVSRQVDKGLDGLTDEQMAGVIIAYEPVWAIGTGETATPEQAQEVHAVIRKLLAEKFSPDVAETVRIQYGGSVKAKNSAELMAQPDIDGALVGSASLTADGFNQLIRNAL